MSSKHTQFPTQHGHIRYWIWTLCLFLSLFSIITLAHQVAAADSQTSPDQRLITVYDQGEEKTFVTNRTTIAAALSAENIALNDADIVEPRGATKLVAKNYTVNIYRARSVVVEDGAQRTQVLTAEQSPKRILERIGSTLYPEDATSFELVSNPIADGGAGLRLHVSRAPAFTFTLYGKTFVARTRAATVGAMLKEKGVVLGAQDGASLSAATPISNGMAVAVWRNGKQTVTQEEVIAKPVEEIKDADQEIGYREVRTAGVNGTKNVTYEIEMRDGKEISRKEIASIVTKEATKEVVAIGAKVKGAYTTPSENETITWNFLIAQGFSRNQTAGIMGNLKQEHGFNTTGDGLAQWTGGRKAALLAMADPYNIYTQLDYLMIEFNGGYSSVRDAIKASSTVDQAVVIFQNKFERCGVCVESRRIQYAYDILASH